MFKCSLGDFQGGSTLLFHQLLYFLKCSLYHLNRLLHLTFCFTLFQCVIHQVFSLPKQFSIIWSLLRMSSNFYFADKFFVGTMAEVIVGFLATFSNYLTVVSRAGTSGSFRI